MARPRILDTNVLINHWRRLDKSNRSATRVRTHAEELVEIQGTNSIVSPVLVEFLSGTRDSNELELSQVFLETFEVLDKGEIPRQDWDEAKRFAQWNRIGRERKLGDCLIQAIAKRLKGDIVSADLDIKQRVPPE
jgi:predicted nucleic acid-binding protein